MGILESWVKAEIYRDNVERGVKSILREQVAIQREAQYAAQGWKTAYAVKFTTILNINKNKIGEIRNFINKFYVNNGLFLAHEYTEVKCKNSIIMIKQRRWEDESTKYSKNRIAKLNPLVYFFSTQWTKKVHPALQLLGAPLTFGLTFNRTWRLQEGIIIYVHSLKERIQITFELRKRPIYQKGKGLPSISYKEEYEPFADVLKALDRFYSPKESSKNETTSRNTKFCSECGKQINARVKFCEHCGEKQ